MNRADFPAPDHGFVITHFLVVSDMDRSRDFYTSMLGGTVVEERSPVIIRVANSWLILNEGGGPTDDKPDVVLETPRDPHRTSAFLNVRVADIAAVYNEWRRQGVEFLTAPKDHGREIRAYVRDPGCAPDRGRSVDRHPRSAVTLRLLPQPVVDDSN
jgi:lactoylglutathione lyase